MQKVRRRGGSSHQEKPLQVDAFPPIESEAGSWDPSANRVTVDLGGKRYEIPKEIAEHILDLWQMLGAVASRITKRENMISLREETLPMPRMRVVKRRRLKLKRK